MSKKPGIQRISFPLSAALDSYKQMADRCLRVAGEMVSSIRRRLNPFKVEERTKAGHPLEIGCRQNHMELQEFIKVLSIGDRIRVLCDDGVLVAEKISQTQFKLIDCQMASKLIH